MQWSPAVSAYREAMLSWQEHEEHLECDKLQVGGAVGGASSCAFSSTGTLKTAAKGVLIVKVVMIQNS